MKTSNGHRRAQPLLRSVGFALALAAGVALADAPQTGNITRPSGVMTFPNVQVVNAPIAANAAPARQVAQKSNVGMRAVVDETTKRLREATTEEAQALSRETRMGAAKRVSGLRAATTNGAADDTSSQALTGRDGSVGLALDESASVFQVVRKNADGSISEECVVGEGAHTKTKTKNSHAAEVRHDR